MRDTHKWNCILNPTKWRASMIYLKTQMVAPRSSKNWTSNSSKGPLLKWTLKSRCSQQQLRLLACSFRGELTHWVQSGKITSVIYVLTLYCLLVQVAAQEGSYLADCFNRMKTCEQYPEGPIRIRGAGRHRFKPFRFVFHARIHLRMGGSIWSRLQNSVKNIPVPLLDSICDDVTSICMATIDHPEPSSY